MHTIQRIVPKQQSQIMIVTTSSEGYWFKYDTEEERDRIYNKLTDWLLDVGDGKGDECLI